VKEQVLGVRYQVLGRN